MGHWLASARAAQATDLITRFDPAYWTINFPRPMMAAVTTPAADTLRVDAVFYRRDDMAGVIWESEDRHDHPLLRYDTQRDYRDCRLSFRWQSSNVLALDAGNGPVLTIEGRDAAGAARTWYVRLWNYARGTPTDARVTIDFAALDAGFLLPAEAQRVWAGDIDRLFLSLVAPGYDPAGGFLPAPVEARVMLSEMRCEGAGATLTIGDVVVPEHELQIASGYDDSYHLTPARLLRQALHLGYRGAIVHYVGMSHYFRLERAGEGLYVSLAGGTLNQPCAAWHGDFARRAKALGYGLIWSLSFELLDMHCWNDWKQRSADGAPALTGWSPPSTLLSPCHAGAMAYLQAVARAFVSIGSEAGLAPQLQVGEPWWWVVPGDARPCLYDASAVAAFAPVPISSLRAPLSEAQRATLDRAGAALAASTAALLRAVRGDRRDCTARVLAYLPAVLDPNMPEVRRMNLPLGWAAPAFDVLQLEDYDWVIAGDERASASAAAEASARLGYPAARQEYLAGFVPHADDRAHWTRIIAAAGVAQARGVAGVWLWALPQVLRDGLIYWREEARMEAFDDVMFPLALGREVEVCPTFSTQVTTSAGGRETRNIGWGGARTQYDAGPGIRSEGDIAALLAFFRARQGAARGFRLRDPFDSNARDAALGTGDSVQRRFALVKHYDGAVRRITRPVAGSVRVKIDDVAVQGFTLAPLGYVVFDTAPAAGARITASFDFDVPVRFGEDRLVVSRATFLAGSAPNVPLIEVREA